MIIVGSIRPGRAGLPVAEWVRSELQERADVELDFVDLLELNLPFFDEPDYPANQRYTKPHTIAWSKRVDAADAFIFVTPEYNHSYSAVLKNAIDFLAKEWWRKPVGFVSYGGIAAGSRGVLSLEPVLNTLGLVKTGANVEIPFIGTRVADGVFTATEKEAASLAKLVDELGSLGTALATLR